ncbi:hypothetical protein [Oceanobacillus halophilus]|uniref:WYL domain-containing protein n=1 Tax=Oceanobacillus halophilus TaxID=930130 RepID=A0A494ZUG0_9BACI|nr:hypothetical protein [Oceanobacillus halophilus]RKQ29665.1 hypothetical protein D8M06_17185 [Oceanobacillus halophilus]
MNKLLLQSINQQKRLYIIYLSNTNQITKRMIRVIRINEDRVLAYCYFKQKFRIFKLENILAVEPVREHFGA